MIFTRLRNIVRDNPTAFLALLVCLGGIFAFISLASEVLEGESHAIDTYILMLFRSSADHTSPLGPPWLQEMMRDITALGGIIVLSIITFGAALYMVALKKYREAFYVIGAIGSGILLSSILKIGFDRPRPDLVPHETITYMASFPSGHSFMSAVVYLTLGTLLAEAHPVRRVKICILGFMAFITLLVGLSRLYLGVHWPTDVLAGWIAGGVWALMAWIIHQRIKLKLDRR